MDPKSNLTPPPSSSLGDRMTDVSEVSIKISEKWISLTTGKEVAPQIKQKK